MTPTDLASTVLVTLWSESFPSSKRLVALPARFESRLSNRRAVAFERPDERPGASVRGATESPSRFGEDDGVTATGESAIPAVGVRGSNLRSAIAGDIADGGTLAVFSAITRSNFAISRRKLSMLAKLDNGASESESISMTECLFVISPCFVQSRPRRAWSTPTQCCSEDPRSFLVPDASWSRWALAVVRPTCLFLG